VALWEERDVLGRAAGADLRARVEALRTKGAGREADRVRHRVREQARRWRQTLGVATGSSVDHDMIADTGMLVALAYPDRVGQRREQERGRFLLRNGRGALLPPTDALAGEEWIVVSDAADSGAEARIYQAAPLAAEQIELLFGDQIEQTAEIVWDARARRVRATRERRLGALVLASSALRDPDPEAVAAALLDGVRSVGLQVLPWNRATLQLRDRLQFLHLADPEGWPDCSEAFLQAEPGSWLGPFVQGMRRLEDLTRVNLTDCLLARAGWRRRQQLEEAAPTHVEVPSGSRIAIDYSDPAAPALAARIQELFGWTDTPRIGGGRVPLTIRLLSPAQRPVQVTSDLGSFWRDAYFDVRKDLRGRYPKHYWPEDPLTATARRGTRPPQS
jgi:ATP-dependent helicase HrpB